MSTIEIGGNKRKLKFGKYLVKIGEKYISKGETLTVSNPTCKLLNPFTLMVNFTVNNTKKYQLIIQGEYKDKYKEFGTDDNPIETDEMFTIIRMSQDKWFLKE